MALLVGTRGTSASLLVSKDDLREGQKQRQSKQCTGETCSDNSEDDWFLMKICFPRTTKVRIMVQVFIVYQSDHF